MYKHEIALKNGFYEVTVTFTDKFNQLNEINKSFLSPLSAQNFAEQQMRAWIYDNFKRYVNHADALFASSSKAFYNNQRKYDSLQLMKQFVKVFENESLRSITLQILNHEQLLRNILPSPSNYSYGSSLQKLEEMVQVCSRFRKALKQMA